MFDKYFKPKSSTWWSGIGSIAYGIYTKDINSIFLGLSAIGLRSSIGDK